MEPHKKILFCLAFPIYFFLDLFLLKKRKIIIFYSVPDFYDNPFHLHRKIYFKLLKKEWKIVWVVKDISLTPIIKKYYKEVEVVKRNSLKCFFYLLFSKFVIINDNFLLPLKPKNLKVIQLWHGLPAKTSGKISTYDKIFSRMGRFISVFVTSSHLSRYIFSCAFNIPLRKFLLAQTPRCEDMIENLKKKNLKEEFLKLLKVSERVTHLILYAPTYRYSYVNLCDSKVDEIIKNVILSLGPFLKKQKTLLVISLHHKLKELKYTHKNVKIVSPQFFRKFNHTLYDFLPLFDVLITDFSSIAWDFLLVDKPIIFYLPDKNVFMKKVGYKLLPIEAWFPGNIVVKSSQLKKEIEKILLKKVDQHKKVRERLKKIFHSTSITFSKIFLQKIK